MLKITAIGNLTHDVELKMNEATGKPYAILRIASDRRYKDKDGNKRRSAEIVANRVYFGEGKKSSEPKDPENPGGFTMMDEDDGEELPF